MFTSPTLLLTHAKISQAADGAEGAFSQKWGYYCSKILFQICRIIDAEFHLVSLLPLFYFNLYGLVIIDEDKVDARLQRFG